MRKLCPMTREEQDFAEQEHNIVIEFIRRKRLPMVDFYDVVIFGYLSAVQQYFYNPPPNVEFRAMAFRAMKDAVLREREYNTRAKRCGFTVSLDEIAIYIPDPRQDIERRAEITALLEQAYVRGSWEADEI